MSLRFCPLFSSSSGNAVFMGSDDTKILIDAGVSCARLVSELKAIGADPAGIRAILVTHEHSDHVAGIGVFTRKYDIPIYATAGTWAAMKEKYGDIAEKNRFVFDAGQDFSVGDLFISSFPIPHDAADPVGFAVRAGRSQAAVATDIGCVREGWLNAVESSDVILLESNHDVEMLKAGRYPYELKRRILGNSGHLSNDAAGRAAVELVRRGVRAIVLGHLSKENNFPELACESVSCALREAGFLPGRDVLLSAAQRSGHSEMFVLEGE